MKGNAARGRMAKFWAKVSLPNEAGCMLWLGAINSVGKPRGGEGNEALVGLVAQGN